MNEVGAGQGGARRVHAAYLSGAAFAVVALIAFLLARGPDRTDGRSIFIYFAGHDDAVKWQAALFGVAAVLFIWFTGLLAVRIAGGERGDRFARIVVVSGAVTVSLYLVGISGWLAVANSFGGVDVQGADAFALGDAATFWNISESAFTVSNYSAAAFLLAAAVGLARTRVVPDWLAAAGGALGGVLLLQGFVQTVGDLDVVDVLAFIAFLAWVAVVSVLLARPRSAVT